MLTMYNYNLMFSVFDRLKGTACFPFRNYFQLNDFIMML